MSHPGMLINLPVCLPNKEARYQYRALTNATVIYVNLKAVNQDKDLQEKLLQTHHRCLEQELAQILLIQNLIRQGSAAEQHRRLQAIYSKLLLALPQKYIADFLGISQQSLSRIRH